MLEKLIDHNERILWQGKPNKLLYVIGSPGIYLFAIVWGVFDYFFINAFMSGMSMSAPTEFAPSGGFGFFGGGLQTFFSLFFIVHLAPVWFAILSPIYRFFSWYNIEYALTDKRIYLVSGIFGRDIVNIELRDIQNLSVDVNPIENIFHLGTIQLTPDMGEQYTANRRKISFGHRFKHIENPYEVYHQVKRVSLDVFTDQMYPNKYRPDENPGYQTKYHDHREHDSNY